MKPRRLSENWLERIIRNDPRISVALRQPSFAVEPLCRYRRTAGAFAEEALRACAPLAVAGSLPEIPDSVFVADRHRGAARMDPSSRDHRSQSVYRDRRHQPAVCAARPRSSVAASRHCALGNRGSLDARLARRVALWLRIGSLPLVVALAPRPRCSSRCAPIARGPRIRSPAPS